MKHHRVRLILAVSCLLLTIGSPLWAQGRRMQAQAGSASQRDPLAFLTRAIQNAGAPALTTAQQQQLQSLIQSYQAARQAVGSDPGVQSAQQSLDDAILSGNAANVSKAADTLAGALAPLQLKNLEVQANFEVQALAVLQPQVAALVQKDGNAGLLRILRSLSGGGPGFRGGWGIGR